VLKLTTAATLTHGIATLVMQNRDDFKLCSGATPSGMTDALYTLAGTGIRLQIP
jgi:hypothetical protein